MTAYFDGFGPADPLECGDCRGYGTVGRYACDTCDGAGRAKCDEYRCPNDGVAVTDGALLCTGHAKEYR